MQKKNVIRQKNRRSFEEKVKEALAKRYQNPPETKLNNQQIQKLSNDPNRRVVSQKVYNSKKKIFRKPPTQINLVPGETPKSIEYPSSDWFKNESEDIDVSIIVPMYKSKKVIGKQIESWDLCDDGLNKEIIYVDDGCPDKSYLEVLKAWTARKSELKGRRLGRIIKHQGNGGFGAACNTGADYAVGKYLLFLNADCTVTQNWIRPMFDLIESNKTIGIVGNMQLNPGGTVDSCGSQWDWKSSSFQHIGRNCYKGEPLMRAMKEKELPEDLKVPGEREMVTGCCFIIPRRLFVDLEGFDLAYKVGYWEDSDINMRVRAAGKRVFFQPESRIFHELGHSKAGGHKHMGQNRGLFKKRWIETGRLDNMVQQRRIKNQVPPLATPKNNISGKVVGCVIACNEEEFLEVSVNSISSVVDEWIFVIGGNEYAYKASMCDKNGYPNDSTLEIAHKLADKYGGRVIEPPGRLWKDKVEMRNAYADHLNQGDWMFMLDGDEVYKPEQLWRVAELMKKYECLIMQFWLFWNNMETIGTGSWEKYPQERIVRWKENYRYRDNHLHVSSGRSKTLVKGNVPTWTGQSKLFYHYSWIRPVEKIRQKLMYYKYQSGIDNMKYVDDIFLKWRDDPKSVNHTHPMGGGNFKPFEGLHPVEVQKMIDEGKFNF